MFVNRVHPGARSPPLQRGIGIGRQVRAAEGQPEVVTDSSAHTSRPAGTAEYLPRTPPMIQHPPARDFRPNLDNLAWELCAGIGNGLQSACDAISEYTDAAGRMDANLRVAVRDRLFDLGDQVQGLADEVGVFTGGDAGDADEVGGASHAVAVARRVWKPDARQRKGYHAMLERAREKAATPPTPAEADALGRAEEAGFLTADGATGATLRDRWTVRCVDAGRPIIEVVTRDHIDGLLTALVGFTPDPGLLLDKDRAAESEPLGARVSDLFRTATGGVYRGPHSLLSHTLPVEGAVAIAGRLVEIVAEVGHGDPPGTPSSP